MSTGIQITARRRFAQFLIMGAANVEVDGVPVGSAKWGTPTLFPVAPGQHQVTVSFKYFGKTGVGAAAGVVDVLPDQPIALTYRTPWIVTSAGTLA